MSMSNLFEQLTYWIKQCIDRPVAFEREEINGNKNIISVGLNGFQESDDKNSEYYTFTIQYQSTSKNDLVNIDNAMKLHKYVSQGFLLTLKDEEVIPFKVNDLIYYHRKDGLFVSPNIIKLWRRPD